MSVPKLTKGRVYAFFHKQNSPSWGMYAGNTPVGRVFHGSPYSACHGELSGVLPDYHIERGFLLEMPVGTMSDGWPTESECWYYIYKVLPE